MASTGKRAGRWLIALTAGVLALGAGAGVGRLAVWGVLVKAPTAHVQQAANRPPSVQGQGITIHGWWTLRVFDRGRLIAERQFENSLMTSSGFGDFAIANLLTRNVEAGPWDVLAKDGSGSVLFKLTNASPLCAGCGALNVDNLGSPPDLSGRHVYLAGQFTPTTSINIASVETEITECPVTDSNCQPTNSDAFNLSFTQASTSQAVASGQQVQVTVKFSFS